MKQEANIGKEGKSEKNDRFDPNRWMLRFIILFALLEVVLMIIGLFIFATIQGYAIQVIQQWWFGT